MPDQIHTLSLQQSGSRYWPIVPEFDIYGGAQLGYRSFTWKDSFGGSAGDTYESGLFFGIHAGARYYFKPGLGAFLELGAGGSGNARLGVAFKF